MPALHLCARGVGASGDGDRLNEISVDHVFGDPFRKSRFKELERENLRLRRAVADLTLDKLILKEAAEWRESAYGYKETFSRPKSTSALPPTADILVAVADFRV